MSALQRIEAPVRDNDSADKGYAYDGKDISNRQSDVDRLLVDQNQPEEQRFLGTEVAFPDALRFKGAAPEIVNSRFVHKLHRGQLFFVILLRLMLCCTLTLLLLVTCSLLIPRCLHVMY